MSWFEHGTSRIYFEEAGTGDPVLLLPGFSGSIKDHVLLRDALGCVEVHRELMTAAVA